MKICLLVIIFKVKCQFEFVYGMIVKLGYAYIKNNFIAIFPATDYYSRVEPR